MNIENLLMHTTPEDLGIQSQGIEDFIDAIERAKIDLHSIMILRHGRIAAQGWWSPYAKDYPHVLFSLSKSFASTAAGLAIAEGFFKLDDTVLSYFADVAPKHPSENLQHMRIRDLLCMGTGHATEPNVRSGKNWEKGFLAHPVEHKPGTFFLYNSMATFMVSSLIYRTTGLKLVDFLKPRLFDPLGIDTPVWDENQDGIPCGGWGLHLTTEDIARFGQLLLQEGVWHGQQIVPTHWVRSMTGYQIDNSIGRQSDWAQGYGFQFWRCRHDAYRGDGMYGQYCLVMPKQDLVIAMTAGTTNLQGVLDCAYDHILPAVKDCLDPDPKAALSLQKCLAELAIQDEMPASTASIAKELLGVRWEAKKDKEENFSPQTLRLMLSQRGDHLSAEIRGDRTSTFPVGIDKQLQGTLTMQDAKWVTMSKASIQKDGSVTIYVHLPEAPWRLEIELKPQGDGAAMRWRFAPDGEKLTNREWYTAKRA